MKKVLWFLPLALITFFLVSPLQVLATHTATEPSVWMQEISLPGWQTTTFNPNTFCADTPDVNSFMDTHGRYNVACFSDVTLYLYRYSDTLSLHSTLSIVPPEHFYMYGNTIADSEGNYYVCWGRDDTNNENAPVISLCKYSYDGTLLGSLVLTGYQTSPYSPNDYWGTKIPFDAGTCAMAINGDILACNFAREMYSGHQSNYVFYLNRHTMERVYSGVPYCSHSFDQDCIPTADGGFLMANHGDAYNRGFDIHKIDATGSEYSRTLFHFREGTNRSFGYNETYAQLGGVAEISNAYVLCASSEKTLSLDTAPTKYEYCSYSEARNLFVQFVKKDFYFYEGANVFMVSGETRTATGTRPATALTDLFLSANTVDYGVCWLTDYEAPYFVANPKMLSLADDRLVILWEKRHYDTNKLEASYYLILNQDGSIHQKETRIGELSLPTNADVNYHDGSLYWTTVDYGVARINVVDVEGHNYVYTITQEATCAATGTAAYRCTDCQKQWTPAGVTILAKIDHVYSNACDATCNNCQTKRTPAAHRYDNACDATCNVCGARRTPASHKYANACDPTCNVCGASRKVPDHRWENGVCSACKASSPTTVSITASYPIANYAQEGTTIKVSVKASGSNLKYTWYIKNAGADKYTKSSVTSATYSVKMSDKVHGRRVYCIITDRYDNSVQTATAILRREATITAVPATVAYAQMGTKAKVTISAIGDGLTYTWYFKNVGKTKYSKSSVTGNTYTVSMSDKVKGRKIYCVVKDKYGKSVQSKTFLLRESVSIDATPATAIYAKKGATAKVTIGASGDGLTYTWYVKDAGATTYTKSSIKTSTYSVKMSDKVKGRRLYCVVTDQYGKTVQSKTMILKMK